MSKSAAAIIRKTLKRQHKITARQVSVKSESCSVRITIKDPTVKLADVEAIARPQEDISRDGRGDILQGGNTFVFVKYSDEALAPTAAPIEELLSQLEKTPGETATVEGLEVWASTGHRDMFCAAPLGWYSEETRSTPKHFYGAHHASQQIAVMLLA